MPEVVIPDWIVKYDKANYQSGAGKAVRFLIESVASQSLELAKLREEKIELEKNLRDEVLVSGERFKSLTEKEAEIERLNKTVIARESAIKLLEQQCEAKDKELSSLRHQIIQDSKEVRSLRESNRELVTLLSKATTYVEWVKTTVETSRPESTTLLSDIRAALTKANPQS